MRQASQEARFNMVVKGMGDLKSYVNRDHSKYLTYVEDLRFPFKNWPDSRARDMSDLLNRLLGKFGKPAFFRLSAINLSFPPF